MMAAPQTEHQRSQGEVLLRISRQGLSRMRESGQAKVRYLRTEGEAILINTGGGLAGGDQLQARIEVDAGASLTVTTQAAERVYQSLGPPAMVDIKLVAGDSSSLLWMPQESILFNGAILNRRIHADLGSDANFLAVESIILGRTASDEVVTSASLRDRWRIHQNGRLVFADDIAFDGRPPETTATLGNAHAFATIVLISTRAETLVDGLRKVIGEFDGASAWNGKLVARLAARDGYDMRNILIPALRVLAQGTNLPKVWSL